MQPDPRGNGAAPLPPAAPRPDGAVRRVGLISVHTTPLAQPGVGDSGGMNVAVAALARELVARGVAVDVFTRATSADLPATVTTPEGIVVHHLAVGPPTMAKDDLASHLCAFYLALAAHPRIADLDVVHAHYWMSGWVARKLRDRLGIPFVQTFHTLARAKNDSLAPGDVPEPALRLAAEERIVADADAILAPTPAEAALLRRAYGAAASRVHIAPLGVDLDLFGPEGDRDAARRSLGGGRIVLFAGRLQPLKGPDVAVRTLAALDRHLPDDGVPARLIVVGGPSGSGFGTVDPPRLAALADELGVGDRLALLAPRPQAELAALYRAADAVLMPSRSESFGLVALEAQACATPVVAAAVGGLRAVVGPGAGTLVEGYDPEDYAAALAPYLTDPDTRQAAGAAGAAFAEAHSWQRAADAALTVYDTVASEAAGGLATPEPVRASSGA